MSSFVRRVLGVILCSLAISACAGGTRGTGLAVRTAVEPPAGSFQEQQPSLKKWWRDTESSCAEAHDRSDPALANNPNCRPSTTNK